MESGEEEMEREHTVEPAVGTAPLVGCQTDRGISGTYWARFDCYELREEDLRARPATLRRWARSAAEHAGRFILRLPDQLVEEVLSGHNPEALWAPICEQIEALAPAQLLLRTRAQLRPSEENITALRRLLADRPVELPFAWMAEGLWEPEGIRDLAEELSLTPVVDPLRWDEAEDGPLLTGPDGRFYWRLVGQRGFGVRFTDYELDRLSLLAESQTGSGLVVFAAPQLRRDAQRWRRMVRDELGAPARV